MHTPEPMRSVPGVEERRIRDLIARSEAAQTDAAALPKLHTDDAVIVNVAGRRLFGRESFASAMAEALASPLAHVRTALDIDDIRFAGPDVAIVSLTKTIHDERPGADDRSALPLTGVMTCVLRREGDDWRIALAQTTPVA
ncbi:SgcJ/EcaC family oxidoreductase [Streptomyces marincola]|uniref:DUF4440 domain-containing protein n=1 Tax=Streptomyces marincola TaxID=2878388 RepID=A0A1W7CT47_9ACTN|nr:SgcJ/EcaC family oxidoreductase [Streptomyces marincola]ARQ67902.1 DUF4440 domain-containing protein [Streptomyces marincola]